MYIESWNSAISQDPGERLFIITKEGEDIYIDADIEENMNLTDEEYDAGYPNGYRVELYGQGDPYWKLRNDEILNPNLSAIGEQRGSVAGRITFYYEDEDDWSYYDNAYECMADIVSEDIRSKGVAVISEPSEVFDLEDGQWAVMFDLDGKYL